MQVVYKSSDGKEFDVREACVRYERDNARKMVESRGDVTLRELLEHITPKSLSNFMYDEDEGEYDDDDDHDFRANGQYGEEATFIALASLALSRIGDEKYAKKRANAEQGKAEQERRNAEANERRAMKKAAPKKKRIPDDEDESEVADG